MLYLISGSREATQQHYPYVKECLQFVAYHFGLPDIVFHGDATGIDQLARQWVTEMEIPEQRFPISSKDWDEYGKAAGPIRNCKMLAAAILHDSERVLIAFPSLESKGTKHMIEIGMRSNSTLFVFPLDV